MSTKKDLRDLIKPMLRNVNRQMATYKKHGYTPFGLEQAKSELKNSTFGTYNRKTKQWEYRMPKTLNQKSLEKEYASLLRYQANTPNYRSLIKEMKTSVKNGTEYNERSISNASLAFIRMQKELQQAQLNSGISNQELHDFTIDNPNITYEEMLVKVNELIEDEKRYQYSAKEREELFEHHEKEKNSDSDELMEGF